MFFLLAPSVVTLAEHARDFAALIMLVALAESRSVARSYTMTSPRKPPRERAARALCKLHGHPPDTRFEGKAMWESYLDEVDAVLTAAIGTSALNELKQAE